MSAARSPYSMRSWPSLRAANSAMNSQIRFMPCPSVPAITPSLRSRSRELALNRGEDVVHGVSSQLERRDRDERDQPDEQRVLNQVLRFVRPQESNQTIHQLHLFSPCAYWRAI